MRLISGLSLAGRLALGFGTILALLLVLVSLSLARMESLSSTLEEITVQNAARSRTLDVLGRSVARYVQVLAGLGSTDLEGGAAVLDKARAALAAYDKAQTESTGMLQPNARAQILLSLVNNKATEAGELIALGERLADGRGPAVPAF